MGEIFTVTKVHHEELVKRLKNGGGGGASTVITISPDGYWELDGVKTNFKAEGKDGVTPTIAISNDGYWVINDVKTEYKAVTEVPVNSVNNKTGNVQLSASDVGADAAGTAATKLSGHNVDETAHSDIRSVVTALKSVIDEFFDSQADDDSTLDRLVEIVNIINSNKESIDDILTAKVNVADIINNLTTNVASKPLSAAQGVALKALIDALSTNKLDASALTSAINSALAQAKASGEFDGAPGANGTSVTVSNVSESTASGGSNVVTFSDGKKVTIKNGIDGTQGKDGKTSYQYAQDGGYLGSEAKFAEDINPDNIREDAKADIKGEVVQELLAALQGLPVLGTVNEDKEIALTSLLPSGTYKLGYKNADGTFTKFCEFIVGSGVIEPSYHNLVDTTPTTDTTITTSSEGWLENVRINSSGTIATATDNHITNIIPVGWETTLRYKGMDINDGYGRIYLYTGKTYIYAFNPSNVLDKFIKIDDNSGEITLANIQAVLTANKGSSATFDGFRLGGKLNSTKEDVIVTLDEEIV